MEPNDAIAHEVLRSIRQIVRQISRHSKSLSRDVGLTVPQLLCLKAVGEAPPEAPLTVALLADAVELSSATVSRIVERLVRGELLSRTRSTLDRRRVILTLTPQGRARFDALPTPLQEQFVARLMAVPEPERRALLTALQRISGLMDAAELDAAPLLVPGDTVAATGECVAQESRGLTQICQESDSGPGRTESST